MDDEFRLFFELAATRDSGKKFLKQKTIKSTLKLDLSICLIVAIEGNSEDNISFYSRRFSFFSSLKKSREIVHMQNAIE